MNRQNVRHTPLPADDVDDSTFDAANVHRRAPVQKRETVSENLTDEQYSEYDSESRSRNSTDLNDDDGRPAKHVPESSRARHPSRPTKQPRKRKARDTNSNNFQQLHTLGFLPPPPPRDVPPGTEVLATTVERPPPVQWPGTLQRNQPQAHIYYPYASATLLKGPQPPDTNNVYYLSSASSLTERVNRTGSTELDESLIVATRQ